MTKIVETDTNGNILATNTFVFDANERLTAKTYGAVGQTYRPIYEKNASGYVYPDNEIIGITLDGKFTDKVTKDGLISGMVSGAFAGAAMSMSGNPMFCFVAGTTVLTTLGKKAIETIQVGDTIPCVDHITGETAEKRVVTTTVNKVDRLIELDIDGEIIQCTETHPFQVKGRGWVNASNLAPNDVVYTKDWNTATVKSVNLLELDEPVEVFNFEVEDCHTYFVGELSILVHNADCGSRGQLRKNMLKEGPAPGSNYQAHHGLPWEHKDYFGKAGLNVNDPKWGRWVKGGGNGGHQSWSKRYGNIWTTYKEAHPNPNADDIIDFFYKLNGGR